MCWDPQGMIEQQRGAHQTAQKEKAQCRLGLSLSSCDLCPDQGYWGDGKLKLVTESLDHPRNHRHRSYFQKCEINIAIPVHAAAFHYQHQRPADD